jgi:hypothetical protein
MFDLKIDDFLSASPGVAEKQNQGPVTQGKRALSGHGAQQRGHLIALKIVCIWERRSFYWDRRDLLTHSEHIRHTDGEVGKEGRQCCASGSLASKM